MALRYARVTGNWADTSTWAATPTGAVGESVPGSGDTVEINTAYKSDGSGGTSAGAITVTLTGDVEVQALRLYSANSGYDATIHTASEHTITCNTYAGGSSSFAGYSAKIHGYTALTGNVNFTFTRDDATTIIIDPGPQGSDKVHDLTFNHADLVCKLGSAIDIEGNLTVTAGTFTTNSAADGSGTSYALTVAGQCSVAGTLTCNGSTVSVGSGLTNTLGMLVQTNGTLTGGTGPHTYGTFNADASGTVNVTLTSNTTTINGSYSDGIAWAMRNGVTFNNGGGDIHFTGSGNQYLYERNNTARTLGDVTVNKSGGNFQWYDGGGAHYTMASLTITQGTFNTNETDGANPRDLTVNGDVNIANGGTLTGNASAISMNSLTLGESSAGGTYNATSETTTITGYRSSTNNAIYANGAIVHNGGTFAFTDSSNYSGIEIQIESGAGSAGTYFNDVTFSGNSTYRFPYYGSNDVTVSGDLTMSGTPDIKQWRRGLIVTGDVTIGDGCVYDCEGSGVAGVSSDFKAGSLTIASGGTFKASSGTTTISTGTIDNDGTLTHNKGTIKIDHDTGITLDLTGSDASVIPVYNLIVDTDNTVGYAACTIGNNLTKKGSGRMRPTGDSGRTIEVMGTLLIEAGTFGRGASDTHTNTFGNVVLTGGTIDLTGGGGSGKTIVKGAFRNVGGTVNTP